ncbi:MAG: DUF1571 domain-containing protein [Bacteroidota bacterium]
MKAAKKHGADASVLLLAAATLILLLPAAVRAQTDCDLDKTLRMFEEAYAPVRDYTCLLSKKEWIDGEYVVWNNVTYKFRKPDCYYMKWTEGENFGREIIYAGKKYGYKLEVHLGGMLNVMNFSLDPKGSIALRSSRHPIMESDFGFILRMIQQNVRKAQKEKSAVIDCLGEAEIDGRKVRHYRAEFPKKKGFINHIINISVDDETNLPIRIEMLDWNDRLVESYTFSDLKINTGLKDADFDTKNEAYGY